MKKANERERFVTRQRAAEMLGISEEAVRRLFHRGTLAGRRIRPDGWKGWSRMEISVSSIDELKRDEGYARRTRKGCNVA